MEPKRKVVAANRKHTISLTSARICNARIVRLEHRMSCDFRNPGHIEEPLFWHDLVVFGDIDVPRNMRTILSSVAPERIYTFKELIIDGRHVNFEKRIEYDRKKPFKVNFEIKCKKLAKPMQTYHVTYVEEGLYNYDFDYYEFEPRTRQQCELISVNKPTDLEISSSKWGDVSLEMIADSPHAYSFEMTKNSMEKSGFSIHWSGTGLETSKRKSLADYVRAGSAVAFSSSILMGGFWTLATRNPYAVAIFPSALTIAFFGLVYAFTPQYTREMIRSLTDYLKRSGLKS